MIRLIQRRLIIPQGDTGKFTIPIQGTMENGDKAIISIYDNLMQEVKLEKEMTINTNDNTLSYDFVSEDTIGIEPDDRGSRYSWDITLIRDEGTDIDSYYAAFGLPPCVIKRVTRNVQK